MLADAHKIQLARTNPSWAWMQQDRSCVSISACRALAQAGLEFVEILLPQLPSLQDVEITGTVSHAWCRISLSNISNIFLGLVAELGLCVTLPSGCAGPRLIVYVVRLNLQSL